MIKDKEWTLTPAYDICHAYDPQSIWVSQHALSINGKRKNQTKEDFMKVAKSMNIKKAPEIIKDIYSKVQNWESYANQTGVDINIKKMIKESFIEVWMTKWPIKTIWILSLLSKISSFRHKWCSAQAEKKKSIIYFEFLLNKS